MGKKMLESEAVKEQIAKALTAGESQTAIGRTLGVSQSTISRLVNKGDVKALIERESLKLLEAVPQAVENVKALVNEMPDIPKGDIKRRELSFKASKKVLESAGLLNTPCPSPTFVNIVSAGTTVISPVIDRILREVASREQALPPLEVNFEEEE